MWLAMVRPSHSGAIAGLLLSASVLSAQSTGIAPCTIAQTSPCSVSGKLTLRHVYGPPWFGEKKGDKPRFHIFVIRLHAPVHIACIREHNSDPVKDCGTTMSIQIYSDEAFAPEKRLRSLVGTEVIATGTTSEPTAPMDQTPGIMHIQSLEALTKKAPNS